MNDAIEWTVTVEGLKEIDDAIAELPVEFQKEILRSGVRDAAEIFRDGMARRAPRAAVHRIVRRGSRFETPLADSIVIRTRMTRDGDVAASVGPSKRAFWGRFVELGTRFMPARPFMRPTLDEDGNAAIAAFASGAKDKLEGVVRRVRRHTAARGEQWA